MTIILLGEGPSDLGSLAYSGDDAPFKEGPLTLAIRSLVLQWNEAASGRLSFLLKSKSSVLKGLKSQRNIGRRPDLKEKAFLHEYKCACYLGTLANADKNTGVVFFKDVDSTNSTSHHDRLWEQIVDAMETGFQSVGCKTGMPMVANPRSEAWLLAYYQKYLSNQMAYNQAQRFESLSGNDASPKSVKRLLALALKRGYPNVDSTKQYAEVIMPDIKGGVIDWERINMKSLNYFKARLKAVLIEAGELLDEKNKRLI